MEHNSIKDIAQMIKEMGGKKVQNNAAAAVDGSNALDVAMTTITYPENRVVNQTAQENKAPESPVDERKTGGAIDNAHLKIKSLTRELIEGQDYFRLEKVPNAILSKAGALKLVRRAGFSYHVTMMDKTISVPDGLISYTMKVTINDEEGNVVSEAFASASSLEKKWAKQGWAVESSLIGIAAKRGLVGAVKNLLV